MRTATPGWVQPLRALLAVSLLAALAVPGPAAVSPTATVVHADPARQAAVGGTLTILAGLVESAGADGAFGPAADGQTLSLGDQLRTGADGAALLTFFDGSETQLTPGTHVQIVASGTTGGPSVFQVIGTTVNRVQQQGAGSFQTDTPSSVALVRGTTFIVTVKNVFVTLQPTTTPAPTPGTPPPDTGPSNFCAPGQAPGYAFGFAALYEILGATMGDPTTCEYGDPNGSGDTLQNTANGLAFYRARTNTPTFTNGFEHWGLTATGMVYWTGDSIDPPPDVVPATEEAPAPSSEGVVLAAGLGRALGRAQPAGTNVCRLTNSTPPYQFLTLPPGAPLQPGDIPNVSSPADCPADSVTTTILLADPVGTVGNVDVNPKNNQPPVNLNQPGQVAGTSGQATTQTTLTQETTTTLQQTTQNLADPNGAQQTGQQGSQVNDQVAPLVVPNAPPPPPGQPPLVQPPTNPTPTPRPATPTATPTPRGSAIGSVNVGLASYGIDLNPQTNRAYVANTGSNNVSVIDTASNVNVGTISGILAPVDLAVNPTTNRVYTANKNTDTLTVINGASNSVAATVSLGANTEPLGVAVNPATNRVYVSTQLTNQVHVINGANNSSLGTISVGSGPRDVEVNPTTNRVYVANFLSNTVSVIDGGSNAVIATIPVGAGPTGIGVNPTTNRIYVANQSGGTVSVIDGGSNAVIGTISGGSPTYVGVNPNTNTVYVSNFAQNSLSIVNGATNAIVGTVPVGSAPYGVRANPATGRVYVANSESLSVTVVQD